MPQLQIVYWRDIPAQVVVRHGRRAERRKLPERFEQAIDRAAMHAGARDEDAYLAEWRRGESVEVEGEAAAVADAESARLDADYPKERLIRLIADDGREELA